ncbi:MAG: hypothetical protein Q7T47_00365, partial [Anaerolineales bacterium]|nr:hypothetical protein [Anaerolineales bacterium]
QGAARRLVADRRISSQAVTGKLSHYGSLLATIKALQKREREVSLFPFLSIIIGTISNFKKWFPPNY